MKKNIFLIFLVGLFGIIGISDVNAKTYKKYEDGTAVYYNPVTGIKCTDYIESNSTTGKKTGCMKFYTFNDSENSTTVNMILDHNTTALVKWNSEESSTEMKEVKIALESDTTEWKQTARLITADEIAQITGANSNETLRWSSDKKFIVRSDADMTDIGDYTDTNKDISWYYLDGSGSTYSNKDGWQKQVAYKYKKSKYDWLYNNTAECIDYGCTLEDSNNYYVPGGSRLMFGYWTSTPCNGITTVDGPNPNRAWVVSYTGSVRANLRYDYAGVRPVITISKSLLDVDNSNTSTDNNENNSNTNTSTGNNENNSNTNTSTGNNENNSNTNTSTDNNENNSNTQQIEKEEIKEDTTTEKNPQTGIKNIGLGILIVGLNSFIFYLVIKNKKVFTK